jgi:hypothetical protein
MAPAPAADPAGHGARAVPAKTGAATPPSAEHTPLNNRFLNSISPVGPTCRLGLASIGRTGQMEGAWVRSTGGSSV